MRSLTLALLATALLASSGCMSIDFGIIYPAKTPPQVVSWSQEIRSDELRVRYEWVAPQGSEALPTVVVQPGIGNSADDMRGVLWDLAGRGYVAVAIDYVRIVDGEPYPSSLPLRGPGEVAALLHPVFAEPRVDTARIGLLGFSRGAAYSLLMAAEVPEIRAAVAYYPITDFERWVDERRAHSALWRFVFAVQRWTFRGEGPEWDDARVRTLLVQSSAASRADDIRAPVLFIHGDRDSIAPLRDSAALHTRLNAQCDCSKIMVVHDGGHAFNFKDPAKAVNSWYATLNWLAVHL